MQDGRLSLTTPEGVRLALTPAGPAPRAAAWLIDLLIWMVFIWICLWIFGGSKLGSGLIGLILFVSYWGYPVLFEVYFSGRTPGKRVMKLAVVRADGLPVGWRESVLRNLLLVADFLPFMYATGLLCMLADQHFRRIGDIVAGTQVIYFDKPPVRKPLREVEPVPSPIPLTPEQQRTLLGLFEREAQLPPERLQELASIAEPLTGETGAVSLEKLRGIAAGLSR
ncbi:RDD family protein [Permianibacter aggregans]|uniref:Putative RDD family membrane protein YckC n=1 Tax=Permianibacter aggregans TaxID=1510150 RepID=A0A4R6UPM5_9GAMM|nr:RDD family protein [Permianibacter aggregans]TDQ47175.1 putative RDD family membrane protein YckC [Permianibacter aggregans]